MCRSPWRLVAESPASQRHAGSSSGTPLSAHRRSPLGAASPAGAAAASPAVGGPASRWHQLQHQLLLRCKADGGGVRVTVAKKRASSMLPAPPSPPPALPPPGPVPELPAVSLEPAPKPAAAPAVPPPKPAAPFGAAPGAFGAASGGAFGTAAFGGLSFGGSPASSAGGIFRCHARDACCLRRSICGSWPFLRCRTGAADDAWSPAAHPCLRCKHRCCCRRCRRQFLRSRCRL